MRFKIHKRVGTFANVNLRAEKLGNSGDIRTGTDISITYKGGKREVDITFPLEDGYGKYSERMFNQQGYYLTPYDNVRKISRKLENVTLTIYDQATKKTAKLVFTKAKAKIVEVTFVGGKHQCMIKIMVQINPDNEKDLPRLAAIMSLEREFELECAQDDLFDTAAQDAADNDPADKGGEQTDAVGDGDGEDEEDEEEDEDDDDDDDDDDDE